jgi:hypothetical protein
MSFPLSFSAVAVAVAGYYCGPGLARAYMAILLPVRRHSYEASVNLAFRLASTASGG